MQLRGVFCMCKVSHGGIVIVDIPFDPNNPHEHHSTHYYCIVSNPASCKFSPVINAIPLTSRCKKVELPTHAELKTTLLPKRSYCLAEQLTLLDKELIKKTGRFIGELEPEAMEQIKQCLKVQLNLT